MSDTRRNLTILNLSGEFIPELGDYFVSRGIKIISDDSEDWTHLIIKDVQNFDEIQNTYRIKEKNRSIISLTKLDDLQNFTVNNGNMVLDDCWFKGPMGSFIMDKYFQGYGGIALGENYPTFEEQGSFNIANPFNTGEYLDRMIQVAFEDGIDALTVKTYFDHLVMYLAGLKNKGKAGYPIEVTYGVFDEIFAVQIHLFCRDLKLLDVTTSLSSAISKKAEEYFLNVTVQSADFFDFSYMPEVNKVIITGLWTKDSRIQFENRGLMFSTLSGGVALAKYDGEAPSELVRNSAPMIDFTNKIVIPDTLPESVSKTQVSGSEEQGISSVTVTGHEGEEDSLTLLDGSDESDDEALLIKGEKELDELIQNVKGKFEEEDKTILRIGGTNKLDVDKAAFRIASTVDQSTKDNELQVRSLGNTLPEKIKTGLFDFAKNLMKPVEDLDDTDLITFQIEKMPQIIQRSLVKEANAAVKQLENTIVSKGIGAEFNLLLEKKLSASKVENDKLRAHLKNLATEVKILKETRNKLTEIQMKAAAEAAAGTSIPNDDDEELRRHYQIKLLEQKALNEQDSKKLSALLERESRLIADVKQEEIKAKKIHIESIKKESFFSQELEKQERTNKAKDLIIIKTKETFTKLMEKKTEEIAGLKSKNEQLSRALASGPSTIQSQQIKDLEKINQNLNKQLEVYKNKVTSLATNIQASKDDDNSKDEARKLQMFNQQLKNQLDAARKDNEKIQHKLKADEAQMNALKQEKNRLEIILKKATADAKETTATPATQVNVNDQEMRRIQAQNQILETHVKESSMKIANLESKLLEAQKAQKNGSPAEEPKVKLSQLENSVKKLTQDLVESRNQLAEMKKETNKLRQDKTALQNQVDKMKKEAEKAKTASPKKGGKAA